VSTLFSNRVQYSAHGCNHQDFPTPRAGAKTSFRDWGMKKQVVGCSHDVITTVQRMVLVV